MQEVRLGNGVWTRLMVLTRVRARLRTRLKFIIRAMVRARV